jgi:hypothetical protein
MSNAAEVMPRGQVLGFGIYFIVLNLALLYILLKIWPGIVPSRTEPLSAADSRVSFLWGDVLVFDLPIEKRYLLMVAVVGALGSYIHGATSFATYVGNRQYKSSWDWWYLLRPFIGTALAVIIYFLVRGGLIAGNSGGENLSPYGVAAIAGMAGMFSKQATDKLEEVFENLFRTQEQPPRRDKLRGEPATGSASGESSSSGQSIST